MKALYLIPFATLALCLAVAQCNPSPMIAAAPESTYALERLHRGNLYVMDSGLTYRDCADYLRHYPESYRCTLEAPR